MRYRVCIELPASECRPDDVRRAFRAALGDRSAEKILNAMPEPSFVGMRDLLDRLHGDQTPLPAHLCRKLRVSQGTSYGIAADLLALRGL